MSERYIIFILKKKNYFVMCSKKILVYFNFFSLLFLQILHAVGIWIYFDSFHIDKLFAWCSLIIYLCRYPLSMHSLLLPSLWLLLSFCLLYSYIGKHCSIVFYRSMWLINGIVINFYLYKKCLLFTLLYLTELILTKICNKFEAIPWLLILNCFPLFMQKIKLKLKFTIGLYMHCIYFSWIRAWSFHLWTSFLWHNINFHLYYYEFLVDYYWNSLFYVSNAIMFR